MCLLGHSLIRVSAEHWPEVVVALMILSHDLGS